MTGIFNKNCYKLFGMDPPKQKITNGSTNKIIQKVKNLQTGLSNNCLESFGVKSQNRKQYITKKEKVGNKNENKNENKNSFFDFLYLYKKYHLQNEIRVLNNNNDYSIKIQMIDNEKEIFIPIENFNTGNGQRSMFKYNDSSYFIRNNYNNIGHNIRFLYEGCLIYIDNTLLVTQINDIDTTQGIPKYPSRYIPIISTLKIPNKLLHSVINGENRQPNDHIPLYFSIINRKFFIRYWNTNLYIDKGNFFILIQNKPLYFNEKIDNIINPNKDKEYLEKKNIFDIYYNYPLKGIINEINYQPSPIVASTGANAGAPTPEPAKMRVSYQNYYDVTIPFENENNGFYTDPYHSNIMFRHDNRGNTDFLQVKFVNRPNSNNHDFEINMENCQVLNPPQIDRNLINIPGYNNALFFSKTLLRLMNDNFVNGYIIYYDFIRNLFFVDFLGMNLYFEDQIKNYYIYTQEYVTTLDQNLNVLEIRNTMESSGRLTAGNLDLAGLTRPQTSTVVGGNPNINTGSPSTGTSTGGVTPSRVNPNTTPFTPGYTGGGGPGDTRSVPFLTPSTGGRNTVGGSPYFDASLRFKPYFPYN